PMARLRTAPRRSGHPSRGPAGRATAPAPPGDYWSSGSAADSSPQAQALGRLQTEEALQVERVLHRVILVVVVERHRDPARVTAEGPGPSSDRLQLARAVEVVVLLRHRRLLAGQLREPAA